MRTRTRLFISAITCLSVLGWWNHRKLTDLREDRDLLSARAVQLGILAETVRLNKRLRPDRTAEARLAASRFIQHHKQREAIRLAGGDPEASPETSAYASREWMTALDSKQIRVVIEEILRDPELDEKSRRKLIGQSLGFLVDKSPAAALSLFSDFSAHLKDTGMGRQVVGEALGKLARENPQAAYAWARNYAKEYPGIIQMAQHALVSNAALQDPALAFEILRELGTPSNAGFAEASILGQSDPALRTMAFEAFRGHLATMNDKWERRQVESRAWQDLARSIAGDGFEAGSKWLLSVKPTPEELSDIIDMMNTGLANSRRNDDAGLWMEWIGKTLPEGNRDDHIARLMESWTSGDHEAAGNWLASAPDGPAKIAATRGYVWRIFKHDPETAMLWINTLPPGKDRDATLKNIHRNWPKDDPAGAAAFANEHGIR
jgi:hypothetical protein